MAPDSRQEFTIVGYWSHSPDDAALPFPQASPKAWAGQDKFLAKLKAIAEKP